MLLKNPIKIFGWSFFLWLISSCNLGIDRMEYTSLPSEGWDRDHSMIYSINAPDTTQTYQWYLVLRNNQDYSFSNLHLISTLEEPNGTIMVDTLSYQMAFPDGNWMGKSSGSLVENKLWYREDFTFPQSGTYTLTLRQAMRQVGEIQPIKLLKGISDLGYSIEIKN